MKPTPEVNKGAGSERKADLRKLRGLRKLAEARGHKEAAVYLTQLEEWMLKRSERTAKRPGGVGRR